ncbi:MAG: glycogen/starch synthase, partial [Pseudomonadota bacterium]
MKILFLSPEAVPFAKTGGLADVAGALPIALKNLGMDVRLVLPLYRVIQEGNFQTDLLINDLDVPLGEEKLTTNVLESKTEEEIPVYLLDREDLYGRPNLYGNARGDYYDNL